MAEWTTEPPTVPGYYWWRQSENFKPVVHEVDSDLEVEMGINYRKADRLGGEWQPVARWTP